MAELSVEVSANISGLSKQLKEAQKALVELGVRSDATQDKLAKNAIKANTLANNIEKLKEAFDRGSISQSSFSKESAVLENAQKDVQQESQRLRKELTQLNQQTSALGGNKGGLGSVKKGAVNATPALQEFSRVIQDAPFGIMGVGNNITQLVSNFGDLSKSAGGAKGALKAMIGSLAGPGGVLFAVSTVVTLLTVFGDKLFNSKSKAEELAEETKKAAEALDKYADSLKGVDRATLKGQQSAADEITTLGILKSQIENTTLTNEERKDGILKLRKEFPAYFQDVKDEALLNGTAKASYDALTISILKRAKATAAKDLLVENQKKALKLEKQLDDSREQAAQDQITRDKKLAAAREMPGPNLYYTEAADKEEEITEAIKKQLDLKKEIADVDKENARLRLFVTENVVVEPKEIKLDTSKSKVTKLDAFYTDDELADIFSVGKEANEKLGVAAAKLSKTVNDELQKGATPVKAYTDRITENLREFSEAANEIITGSVVDTFGQLGNAIGTALAEGGNVLAAIGTSIIQGLSNFLGEMGGLLIKYGTLAVAKGKIDIAIAAGGPIAIGAGFAAIAVGVALKAASAALGSAAKGGFSGASSGNVGGQGSGGSGIGSNSNSGATFSQSGSVVFEIAGTKLVGVLNRTLDRNKRLGGNLSLT